jgi:diguanylate cyclase (GGDEF)-like protein
MASPIRDADGKRQGMIMIFRDVTEKRNISRQISWQATHDPLTRLINRREFENRLENLVHSARRDGYNHVLCYLDLDQFKIVNDSYGHTAGDELLKKLSAALRVHVRGTDTLARLGGDEFGVLLYSCSVDKARLIADGLRQLVEDFRFLWNGKTLRVGVSIGLVEIGDSWQDISEVLSAADTACYTAKDNGRNRIHIYKPNDQVMLKRNGEMRMIQDIQHALDNGNFELHQQHIKALGKDNTALSQCEILVRMKTESDELIDAEDFIPTAERYRLMPQIDRWVVRATLNAIHFKHPCFKDLDSVAINISAQSLCDDRFLQFILELLSENDIPANLLCFEISEASYISNQLQANNFIQRLRDKGCRFSLDNFGAVSSSFNFLKHLKVDFLKIDGDFITNITTDEMERNMVDSINHMGHRIGMKTIAQHIPDAATLSVLRELGVDYAQGYGIEKPLPINNLLMKKQA